MTQDDQTPDQAQIQTEADQQAQVEEAQAVEEAPVAAKKAAPAATPNTPDINQAAAVAAAAQELFPDESKMSAVQK